MRFELIVSNCFEMFELFRIVLNSNSRGEPRSANTERLIDRLIQEPGVKCVCVALSLCRNTSMQPQLPEIQPLPVAATQRCKSCESER